MGTVHTEQDTRDYLSIWAGGRTARHGTVRFLFDIPNGFASMYGTLLNVIFISDSILSFLSLLLLMSIYLTFSLLTRMYLLCYLPLLCFEANAVSFPYIEVHNSTYSRVESLRWGFSSK
ncbi:hypothetical protein BDQ94DRAFT_142340 [Aspergillus welwitschiae]|uniref:Uncharacterized protein n=1 Tax=Aspergillus welwitschiae TaxID=1341132 RepID=A0A3F3Q520_9EURO|nr:hypothetical protein BDQ94DRAFT_142340 [Aspergillus welwitschiae]RDH34231.1 hypothetical protein BDQ94DRAFT_142340 [Aspergillus welwitschiae]